MNGQGNDRVAPDGWRWLTGCLWALALVGPSHAGAPCKYDVTILQGPWCNDIFEFPVTRGQAINDAGTLVGSYAECTIGPSRGFQWTADGGFIILDRPLGYDSAAARDISSVGTIAGVLGVPSTDGPYAALWQSEGIVELGTLPAGDFSIARAVNSRGQVVGEWGNEDFGPFQGFEWKNGIMSDLGSVLSADASSAQDINDAGEIVGWVIEAPGDDPVAFLIHEDEVTILGHIPSGFMSKAEALNIAGDIVGLGVRLDQKNGGTVTRPFLWSDGRMSELGTLPGFARSAARDINDAGIVVGDSWDDIGNLNLTDGFLWRDGVMVSLSDLIDSEERISIRAVTGVNNVGQITGQASTPTGNHAILLTPVGPPLGDLDADCVLTGADVGLLLSSWGGCVECAADLDGDGSVGVLDLLIMLGSSHW